MAVVSFLGFIAVGTIFLVGFALGRASKKSEEEEKNTNGK